MLEIQILCYELFIDIFALIHRIFVKTQLTYQLKIRNEHTNLSSDNKK